MHNLLKKYIKERIVEQWGTEVSTALMVNIDTSISPSMQNKTGTVDMANNNKPEDTKNLSKLEKAKLQIQQMAMELSNGDVRFDLETANEVAVSVVQDSLKKCGLSFEDFSDEELTSLVDEFENAINPGVLDLAKASNAAAWAFYAPMSRM
jgi:hypothetical protein